MSRSMANTIDAPTASSAIGETAAADVHAGDSGQHRPIRRISFVRARNKGRRDRRLITSWIVESIEAAVGVGLKNAGEALKMPRRMFAATIPAQAY